MNINEYPLVLQSRNLVRFCRHSDYEALDESFAANFGFRDKESRFSFLKNVKTLPGPDECFSHADIDARPVFKKLLGMKIEYPEFPEGGALDIYNSMNYYRSHIEEYFYHNGSHPLPPVSGKCLMYYAASDALNVEYELKNNSDADVLLRVSFISEPAGQFDSDVECVVWRGFSLSQNHKVVEEHSICAALSSEGGIDFDYADGIIKSKAFEKEIKAGETLAFRFQMTFSINESIKRDSSSVRIGGGLAEAVSEAENTYRSLPEVPEPFKAYKNLLLNAAGTLRALRYLEIDKKGRAVSTVHAGKCGVCATWFWDSAFTMLGLGLAGESKNAYGAARLLVDGIKEDGTPPCKYGLGEYIYGYQQPILAWGIGNLFSLCPDEEFLSYAYKPLCCYVRHWLEKWDAADKGLVVYPPGGTCWDDSLRWQDDFPIAFKRGEQWASKCWGKMRPDIFMNVDTNTHLYLECLALSRFAEMLEYKEDSKAWREKAENMASRINSELYNKDAGAYQDRSLDGRFNEMITPSSFMPLYAGIAPLEIARKLCWDYLLNPERFYSLLPFPTLDMKHPAFRSGGFLFSPPGHPGSLVQQAYWHGRTWPHVSYWLVGGLCRSGLENKADEAAGKILEAMSRSEAIYECYDSLTGYGNGHPEFAWSSAAVLALAFESYKKGPLGDF